MGLYEKIGDYYLCVDIGCGMSPEDVPIHGGKRVRDDVSRVLPECHGLFRGDQAGDGAGEPVAFDV